MDNKNSEDWWRSCCIYQIYPRSYMDTNHDGVGDLNGITQKLEYIASLNVDAIWISPIFTSPMKDFGYDVSNYCDIDPIFGSLEDFDRLVEKAHSLGLKIMLDQVVNHTSDQHPWFKESRSSKNNPYTDWYVWADPKPDGTPPNNWLSVFGGSAWTWDSRRKQYYLHNFLSSQPDLNFYQADVQEAVLNTFEFWLKRGVDGFRLDTANYYFHDTQLRDNPPSEQNMENAIGVRPENPYAYQQHIYDKSRPENIPFLEKLRRLLDQYPGTTTVGEIGCDKGLQTMAAYTSGNNKLHMAYTFDLLSDQCKPEFIRETMENIEQQLSDGWPCWSIGNHDVARVVTRWNKGGSIQEQAIAYLTLLATLRGSICIYQGEELGLPEAALQFDDLVDPYGITFWPEYQGRDGCRTPMPWQHDQVACGFSTSKPWLPIAEPHQALSVSLQEDLSESTLNISRRVLAWRRQQPALLQGGIEFLDHSENSLVFRRDYEEQHLFIALNLSNETITLNTPLNIGSNLSPWKHALGADIKNIQDSTETIITLKPWQTYIGQIKN